MLTKTKIRILLSAAIIFFLLIFVGYTYLLLKYPIVFQKKYPAVMVINIDGEIITTNFYGIYEKRGQNRSEGTSSTNIVRMLEYFSKDDSIKAFILEIDSYGGQTSGKEEIARFVKRMDKPVVAVIKGRALFSGYFVAANTDKIYAHKSAKIGELANTFVYVDRTRSGEHQVCHITSSNYRSVTLEDCKGFDPIVFEKLRRQVGGTYELLVSNIAEMRNISKSTVESVANDEIIGSKEALKLGLIDELGTTEDAVSWLENELNTQLWVINLRDTLSQI